ncbi:MAG TPA: DUF4010 domain-containing protein [Gemmatimonadales bacterium]|jgi:uncharacterized membrane protein (DUF4010 family)
MDWVNLVVAALIGLAVGIEREWSGHASGPHARFAGVRTFFLLGIIGGAAGLLVNADAELTGAVLIAGGAALSVAAYVMAARRGPESIEGTTETAAIAVLAIGALAGTGATGLAAGVGAVVVLALREKTALHRLVGRIGDVEMRAAFQFAVLALVILPLLPAGPYGPLGGVEPRKLWLVVLIMSGLSFIGYVARRVVGTSHGYAVTGILGGVISSTAVTLNFSRRSREHQTLAVPLAIGVIGACTVLPVRVLVVTLALNSSLALPLIPYLAPPFVVGLAWVLIPLLRHRVKAEREKDEDESRNPLRLGSAIGMAIGFQAVLMLVAFVRERFGDQGVLPTAALLGFTDMDALTLAMNRLGNNEQTLSLAARALSIGIISNTVLKLGIATVLGRGRFRFVVALGLLSLGAGSLLGLWLFW